MPNLPPSIKLLQLFPPPPVLSLEQRPPRDKSHKKANNYKHMKKTLHQIALITGLIAVGSLSAIAEPGDGEKRGPKRHGGHGGPDRKEILKDFDKDGDGKLSDTEKQAARAAGKARRAAFIAEHDTDNSGTLDEGERKAAHAAMILKRFDADNSGDLSVDEQAKADAAMKHRRAAHAKAKGKGRPSKRTGKGKGKGRGEGEEPDGE